MNSKKNVQLVQDAFAAFRSRDLAGVMKMFADDIEWSGARPAAIPFGGHRRGLADVGRFFATLNDTIEYEFFDAHEYLAQNERVVAFGRERFVVKATGKRVENEWAMVFSISHAKIARVQIYEDTAAVAEGFKI